MLYQKLSRDHRRVSVGRHNANPLRRYQYEQRGFPNDQKDQLAWLFNDATATHLRVPNATAIAAGLPPSQATPEDATVLMRMRSDSDTGANQAAVSMQGAAPDRSFNVVRVTATDAARSTVSVDGTAIVTATTGTLVDGQVHTVVCRLDTSATELAIFVDGGSKVATVDATLSAGLYDGSSTDFNLASRDNGVLPYDGRIDVVALYFGVGTALSDAQIALFLPAGTERTESDFTDLFGSAPTFLWYPEAPITGVRYLDGKTSGSPDLLLPATLTERPTIDAGAA